jgi:hypothetical protein
MKDEGGGMNSAETLFLHLVLGAFHYSNKDLSKLDCFPPQRYQTSRRHDFRFLDQFKPIASLIKFLKRTYNLFMKSRVDLARFASR